MYDILEQDVKPLKQWPRSPHKITPLREHFDEINAILKDIGELRHNTKFQ